jgi:tetratricopeptide (TPR) repeat protein
MKRRGLRVFALLLVFTGAGLLTPNRACAQPTSAQSPAGQSLEILLRDAGAAENRFDSKTALALYLRANDLRPRDAFILQKVSRQYSDLATDTADEAERIRLCTSGLSYAQKSVELAPDNAVNVLSVAICYGKLALWSDIRTRIRYSKLVQEYARRALALNPNYDYAHHVLGRWHYEVATLGATRRWLVRLIYGELPPASLAEAVSHLKQAAELAPQLPAHRVELGFALLAEGKKSEAKESFQRAIAMPMREKYDSDAIRRAREALAGL